MPDSKRELRGHHQRKERNLRSMHGPIGPHPSQDAQLAQVGFLVDARFLVLLQTRNLPAPHALGELIARDAVLVRADDLAEEGMAVGVAGAGVVEVVRRRVGRDLGVDLVELLFDLAVVD